MENTLAEVEMLHVEEGRQSWEWVAALVAVALSIAAPLVLELGPLFY
jgi:hypothetical protein